MAAPRLAPDPEDARHSRPQSASPSASADWWPLLVVIAGVAAGVTLTAVGAQWWRLGCLLVGGSLLVGAVERLVLTPRRAGLLVVRSRAFDVAVMALAGIAILVLTVAVPPPR